MGASGGAATASTRTHPTASSSIAAEAADGLHPLAEAPESPYSVAATVAATVLADEAKEEGNEAWHLTSDKFSFAFFFLFRQVLITCLKKMRFLIQ